MNVRPRILVLTLSFGSGHVRAAEAIAKELKQQAPGAEVSVVDALEVCRWWFRAIYAAPYWIMVRHFPWAWRWLFKSRVEKLHRRTAPEWLFRFGCDRLFEQISSAQHDAIVAVEVAACEMVTMARCNGLTDARIISVITDHEAEPAWVKREVDAYAVPDETVSEQLISWGAPRNKIHVTGIAVDDSFRLKRKPGSRQGTEHGA